MSGGAGDDRIIVSSASDFTAGEVYDGGDGIDTLTLGTGIYDLSAVTFTGIEKLEGTWPITVVLKPAQFDGLSTLHAASVIIAGTGSVDLSGADVIVGTFSLLGGGSTLDLSGVVSVGTTVYGSVGKDVIFGTELADVLHGDLGDDRLYGGGGDDFMVTDPGADSLYGGAGTDTLIFVNGPTAVTANLATGVAIDGWAIDTLSGIENLVGTVYGDTLIGDAADNMFDGGPGTGADVLSGGAGIDTLTYANAGAKVIVNLAVTTAQATGGGGVDTISGFENLIGSAYADTLSGDGGVNVITGGLGNDQISGGAGADTLYGGDGDDTLGTTSTNGATLDGGAGFDIASFAGVASAVNVSVEAGSGVVHATGGAGNVTMTSIEGLIGTDYADTLTGDAGDNGLYGGAGNDLLIGGAGNDRLDGGYGADTASYADAAAGIILSLVSQSAQNTGGAGIDTLYRVENVVGSAYADTLTGNDLSNTLTGGDGNDTLSGGLGNDTLSGGDGIDTVSYATATGDIRANLTLTSQQSTISAGSDTLSGFENIMGGAHDDQLTGDTGNNILTGNAGNDLLVGGAGDDTLSGGAGSDTASYASAAAGVTLSLAVSAAQDTLGAGIDTLISIENVTGSAYDDMITGSAQVNVINGGTGNDTIDAGSSNDTVDGGYGNDILKGAGGDDILIGNVGTDTITGGGGADTLTGGTQADRFVYVALTDSTVAASDRITDLAKGDILDVSAIDANSTMGGNQAFVQAAAFSHTAGEFTLAYDAGTNTTTALFDTNGDATADMAILFTGDVTTLTGGWVL